ncbi:2-isopropylmalate synthase [Lactococcus lactis subsp. lactis]|uniref:2-isopropylmalate synthase n=2 Tax=Bacteria TaxID=2 RepID=A0A1V0NGC0_LACLL|nr:2-isopropylmalate synthase [Lactococcus lactis]ADZ63827.1 2-isopropylmalate synthase [Lactococcus lactis subsp. lactis CV56]ARD98939.1 2-isopropylmalate synthase [Lactococcus lactis subsp. lactis]EHE93366.1 2-isopropylmalate synthase [Lactococcus lactis subsp. lactis CNCM I-1631]KAF0955899.1 2-isopropylmalate synthase [Lactococcus lactis subsp. lactis]KSU26779.1 2-isopropylmalate synthase [Lactococcus lactis subsp. lactis]
MRKIEFFDTSLRDGEQTPGVSFCISEKVTIAKQLEKWGISVIEAGFPAASPDSFEAVKQIADSLNDTAVTALARCVISDIDKAVEAVKGAKYPQIHVFIATSPIHMKYKLKISTEEVLKNIDKCVKYARERVEVVEFSPEDATRTELNFLLEAVQTAVDAGATYINIPDTVGYTTPEEYGKIFKFLIDNTKSEREIIFSPHCHDDLGMAVANSLAAIKAGAGRVEGTVNGIGERAGNAALEEIAVALHIRKDFYQAQSPLKLSETAATAELISQFSGIAIPKNKAIVGANAFAHESVIHQDGVLKNAETYEIITPELVGIKHNSLPLGKLSGRHAFSEKLTELNIAYDDESLAILFEKFKKLADKKKEITDADIHALFTGETVKNLAGFILDNVQIDGHKALVQLKNQEEEIYVSQGEGAGSVDAIFKAIDKVFNHQLKLISYSVDAVTDGIDAQATTLVSVENLSTGTIFNAKDVDYDVLKGSAIAYMNANVLVQKENLQGKVEQISAHDGI